MRLLILKRIICIYIYRQNDKPDNYSPLIVLMILLPLPFQNKIIFSTDAVQKVENQI